MPDQPDAAPVNQGTPAIPAAPYRAVAATPRRRPRRGGHEQDAQRLPGQRDGRAGQGHGHLGEQPDEGGAGDGQHDGPGPGGGHQVAEHGQAR
ncbi:hypothetical protein ACFSTC_42560 [Nonomuraea ferruginea]